MRRVFDPAEKEWMDREQPVTPELSEDLENLGKINRWFGGHSLPRKFIRHWLRSGRKYRILDLATGYGDVPRMVVDWARAHDVTVEIDAVDQQQATLQIAKDASRGYPEIQFIRSDIRTYSPSMTYDIVLCSLALHHFSEDDALHLLRHLRTLSHDAILVSDLERNWLNWGLIQLMTKLVFTAPMTVHDAKMSMERAFSFGELDVLATEAGWEDFDHRRFPPARQAIWMHVRDVTPAAELASPAINSAALG